MRKNVMIRLTSVQRDESGEDEKISLETPGIYGEEDGYSGGFGGNDDEAGLLSPTCGSFEVRKFFV